MIGLMFIGAFISFIFGMMGAGMAEERNRPQIEGFLVGFLFNLFGLFFYQKLDSLPLQQSLTSKEIEYSKTIEKNNLKNTALILAVFLVIFLIYVVAVSVLK
jgi:hypothetical protein